MPVVVDLPQSAVDAVVRVGIDISSVRVATTLREADGDRQLAVATASGLPGAGTRGCTTGLGGGEEQREGSEDFEHVSLFVFLFFILQVKKKMLWRRGKKSFFCSRIFTKKILGYGQFSGNRKQVGTVYLVSVGMWAKFF